MATAADAGEFSSLSSREDELDLTSETFNPLKALRADSVEIPIPRAKIYDNLDQFRRHVLEGQASVGVPRPGGSSKSAKKLQKPQCLHSGTAEETPTLPEKESTVQKRNVLTRMKSYSCGPLGRLREIVDQRKRVRVWTRNYKEMRGHCTGFLIIFDKHWNLVLVDVEEVFQRKLHRKPLLPEGKLRGEFVKRMNLEDTKGETEKGDFSVMKADLVFFGGKCSRYPRSQTPDPRIVPFQHLHGRRELCQRYIPQIFIRGDNVALIQILPV